MDLPICSRLPHCRYLFSGGRFASVGEISLPGPLATMWRSSVKRFRGGARSSGFRNSKELWEEDMGQVASGWLMRTAPFSDEGAHLSLP